MVTDTLPPGELFAGEYAIEAVAGRGAMGVVYRAFHSGLERRVAIKVATPALADQPEFRERLLREARLAAQIEHPSVVSVHHAGDVGGRPYVILQWVDGGDLRSRLATGPLDVDDAMAIINQLSAALDAAHATGCLHRDVKPANVLIRDTPGGMRAYLTDFGVAKALQEAASAGALSSPGEFVGTPAYLAPEHAQGGEGDARSDLYGLGCVAFEILSGTAPFSAPTVAAMLVAHCVRPRPLLSERRPGLPPEVDDVLTSAMAIDPAERPESGAALARALHIGVYGEDPVLKPPMSRRRRAALVGAGALVLGGVAAGAVALKGDDGLPAGPSAPVALRTTTVAPQGRDKIAAEAGDASRTAVINLFNAYARWNRSDPEKPSPKDNPVEHVDAARLPRANGSCGTLHKIKRVPKLHPKKGLPPYSEIEPIQLWHYHLRAVGGAPIAFPGLDGSDMKVSTSQGAISWEGTYRTRSYGTGRVRMFAIKDKPGSAWRLFYLDFCPDKPTSA